VLSRRGPLVRHARAGWRGAPLAMLKFRTMWSGNELPAPMFVVEDVTGNIPASKNEPDERVSSAFAAFCRRYSLDEIPQLYHVARGEMSLVGPRPITFAELKSHYGRSAEEVLSLRPGLTGLWQIMGRNRLSYESRRRLDLMFVRRASAGMYVRILLQSIPRVLSGSGAR
jgi:exopolysaccharide production protein ExoY